MNCMTTPEALVPAPCPEAVPVAATATAESTVRDYAREWEERRAQEAAERAEERARLLNDLRLLGATTFEGEYDGQGDSGEVTSLIARNADTDIAMPEDLLQRLDNFVWNVAYGCSPGFENNEGGFGTLTWDLGTDEITVDHSDRYVEVSMRAFEL